MITLHCDKCDKPFETEDEAAGGKVECPYCGDINRVPAANATAGARIGTAKAESASASVEPEGETVITIVRQAMFRAHPYWYSLLILIFLGGIALAVWAGLAARDASSTTANPGALNPYTLSMWAGVGMAVAAVLWWVIWWAAPHRWIKLTITNRRTIRQEGIIVRRTSEVLHDHIRNVKIEQSVMQRLLSVGTISIDSAGGSESQLIEIQMEHVAHPYRVKQIIDKYRRM